jgi:hypothetical protein
VLGDELIRIGDVDGVRQDVAALDRQLLRVRAVLAADDDHRVDLASEDHGVVLPGQGHRTDGVHDPEVVRAAKAERGELLQLLRQDRRLAEDTDLLGPWDTFPCRTVHVVDDDVLVAGVRADALDLGVVLVSDDADRVAGLGELARGLLRLEHPGAGGVDDLEIFLAGHPLEFVLGYAMRPDHQRPALDLVREVRGSDATVRQVGLDPGVVHELPEGRDVLALGARVLRLVDGEAHAVAEAGTLGDTNIGSDGRCHHVHGTALRTRRIAIPYIPRLSGGVAGRGEAARRWPP